MVFLFMEWTREKEEEREKQEESYKLSWPSLEKAGWAPRGFLWEGDSEALMEIYD